MSRKILLEKILAIAGSALMLVPVCFTVFISFMGIISGSGYNFDYLLPAELFPFALAGMILLILAAFFAKTFRRAIFGCSGAIAVIFIAGIIYLQVSGVASGATEPTALTIGLTIALMAVYSLLTVLIGIFGILLTIKTFKNKA
ncbi:MAG: hypothetical protein NTV44_05825 [Firmicutes bacterium]|nr:hypothetical protein [Bacillota bacterium]